MVYRILTLFTILYSLFSVGAPSVFAQNSRNTGTAAAMPEYRVVVQAQGREFPFWLGLKGEKTANPTGYLRNGAERIALKGYKGTGDTLVLPLHIFDSELKIFKNGRNLTGVYDRNKSLPTRRIFPLSGAPAIGPRVMPKGPVSRQEAQVASRYRVVFFEDGAKDTTKAVGLFEKKNGVVTGTFETSSGDYRFLEGTAIGDSLLLTTFDGAHLYLFAARIQGDRLEGLFISGPGGRERFRAVADGRAKLPSATSLARPAHREPIQFAFPDTAGRIVSSEAPAFKGSPMIVQIGGTWCPNCMDETSFFSAWYNENPNRPAKPVLLSFEASQEPAYFKRRLDRLSRTYRIGYPMLNVGPPRRDSVMAKLPFIQNFGGFPTTLFLDKEHRIRFIHTGFSGPATGEDYEDYKAEFARMVEEIER